MNKYSSFWKSFIASFNSSCQLLYCTAKKQDLDFNWTPCNWLNPLLDNRNAS